MASLTLADVCAVLPQQEYVWAGQLAKDLTKRAQRTISYKRVNDLLVLHELTTVSRSMRSPADGVEREFPHYSTQAIIDAEARASELRAQDRLKRDEERQHKRPGRPSTNNVTLQLRVPEDVYAKLITQARERGEESSSAFAVRLLVSALAT